MRVGGRGAVGDTRRRLGSSLVVCQVALSLALLSTSGLLLGSFRRLMTVDTGFRHAGVVIAQMDFRNAHYAREALLRVNQDVLARLRAAPGVSSASASWILPISGAAWDEFVAVDPYVAQQKDSVAFMNGVSDGYFATLGTALLRGRGHRWRRHHAGPARGDREPGDGSPILQDRQSARPNVSPAGRRHADASLGSHRRGPGREIPTAQRGNSADGVLAAWAGRHRPRGHDVCAHRFLRSWRPRFDRARSRGFGQSGDLVECDHTRPTTLQLSGASTPPRNAVRRSLAGWRSCSR